VRLLEPLALSVPARPPHVTAILVAALAIVATARAGWTPQGRCAANQKTLQTAIEAYNLDRNTKVTSIDGSFLAGLTSRGYLAACPTCLGPYYTFGSTRGGPSWTERLFPGLYRVEIPLAGALEYRYDGDGVRCTAHGPLSEVELRADAADPPARKLLERFAPPIAGLATLVGVVLVLLWWVQRSRS
jgi:hypothetical protein